VNATAGFEAEENFINSFLRRSITVILTNSLDRISSTADSGNLVCSGESAAFEEDSEYGALAGDAWRVGCVEGKSQITSSVGTQFSKG
jgi:hypothetical protein